MQVINNGKGLTLKASYTESSILASALRQAINHHTANNEPQHADEAKQLLDQLNNHQILKKPTR